MHVAQLQDDTVYTDRLCYMDVREAALLPGLPGSIFRHHYDGWNVQGNYLYFRFKSSSL